MYWYYMYTAQSVPLYNAENTHIFESAFNEKLWNIMSFLLLLFISTLRLIFNFI